MRRDLVLLRKATARRMKAANSHKLVESKSAFEPYMPRAAAAHFFTIETIPAVTQAGGEWTPGRGLATPCESFIDGTTKKFRESASGYSIELVNDSSKPVSAETLVRAYLIDGEWVIDKDAGSSDIELFAFQLTSNLVAAPGSTATATATYLSSPLLPTVGITVTNSGAYRGLIGATGLAIKALTNVIYAIEVNQPARLICVLAANPSDSPGSRKYAADPRESNAHIVSASCRALSTYPNGFVPSMPSTVANPLELFGEQGDSGILQWDQLRDAYILEEVVPQRAQLVWAKLASDRPNGLNAVMSCVPIIGVDDGALPSNPFSVTDTFNLAFNAKGGLNGDEVLARWQPENARYVAIEARHVATIVTGTVEYDFDNAPADFTVENLQGLNGRTPTSPITVKNRYKWVFGRQGKKVEVLWDGVVGEWYGNQMEAPESLPPQFIS